MFQHMCSNNIVTSKMDTNYYNDKGSIISIGIYIYIYIMVCTYIKLSFISQIKLNL